MTTTTTAILATLFFSSVAFASDAAPATPSSQPTLTILQEVRLYNALTALDGHAVIPKVNGQDQPAVSVAYDFTGEVRWKIRGNLAALQPKYDAWQKVQHDDLKFVSAGTNFIPVTDQARQSLYAEKITADSQVIDPSPPKLQTLSQSELKMTGADANPIPGSVLNDLAPILQL